MERSVAVLLGRVRKTIRAHSLIQRGGRVLAAVSGGPDSTGLLLVLGALQRRLGFTLVAGHVNHGLRGAEADEDERCAAEAAAQIGVDFVRAALSGTLREGGNLEARARVLRYRALHQLARNRRCGKIATGHTLDDQAETVLLRLVRGSGPAGLQGIQIARADGVIRPLLECPRDGLRAAVAAACLRFRRDPTNEDERFDRNRIRRRVLPVLRELNPAVARAIGNAAKLFAAEAPIVEAWIERQLGQVAEGKHLSLTGLAGLPTPLHGHLLRSWLLGQGIPRRDLTERHVAAVQALMTSRRASGWAQLPAGRVVARSYDGLILDPPAPAGTYDSRPLVLGGTVRLPDGWTITVSSLQSVERPVRVPDGLSEALCDGAHLGSGLAVRCPRPGDRLRPLGLGGSRKLADIFVDRKVPAAQRPLHPVVECGGEIVWVPGVTRSDALAVDSTTETVLRLRAGRHGSDRS